MTITQYPYYLLVGLVFLGDTTLLPELPESLLDLLLPPAGVAALLVGLLALGVLLLLLAADAAAGVLAGVVDFLLEAAALTGSVLLDLAREERDEALVSVVSFLALSVLALEMLPTDLA